MNDYLTKPVDPAALYATLEKWLHIELEGNPARRAAAPEPPEKETSGGHAGRLSLDVVRDPGVSPAKPEGQAVNVEAGLATVGGNRALYRELLLRFVDHYGESARNLRGLLACGDLRGAARLAHTVKGVAANLGVERVCQLTRRMPVRVLDGRKDAVKAFLAARDIPTGVHYKPNHLLSFFGGGAQSLPVTEQLYAELVTLPMHPGLSAEDVESVCDALAAALK